MGIYKYQTVPQSTDSKRISDALQAQGIDVEVYLNHQTGECHIRWGEESQTAKHIKLDKSQQALMKKIVEATQ